MAIYPGAIQRPLTPTFVPCTAMAVYNRINFHVTAGKGSPYGTFARPKASSSHFFVYKDGRIEQFVDTRWRAEADLDGNDATVSIETEGAAPGVDANAEPWTEQQMASLVSLSAWIVQTHGIPLRLATDSKIGASSHGFSWHRLGIDGNFPASHPGRKQLGGGMYYSKSTGKVCPGNRKIEQIRDVLDRTVAIMGQVVAPPVPAPAPAPAPAKPARNVAQSKATQAAVRVSQDTFWGDETEAAVNTLRAAINGQFPAGVKAAQRVVGTAQDGVWGPKSRAALKSTVAALQRAWGTSADGIWGPNTEAAWGAARARNLKNW